jgi:hypothetical protein
MTTVELIIREFNSQFDKQKFLDWFSKHKDILREKEKQQIIDTAIEFGNHGTEMMQERGEEYYKLMSK